MPTIADIKAQCRTNHISGYSVINKNNKAEWERKCNVENTPTVWGLEPEKANKSDKTTYNDSRKLPSNKQGRKYKSTLDEVNCKKSSANKTHNTHTVDLLSNLKQDNINFVDPYTLVQKPPEKTFVLKTKAGCCLLLIKNTISSFRVVVESYIPNKPMDPSYNQWYIHENMYGDRSLNNKVQPNFALVVTDNEVLYKFNISRKYDNIINITKATDDPTGVVLTAPDSTTVYNIVEKQGTNRSCDKTMCNGPESLLVRDQVAPTVWYMVYELTTKKKTTSTKKKTTITKKKTTKKTKKTKKPTKKTKKPTSEEKLRFEEAAKEDSEQDGDENDSEVEQEVVTDEEGDWEAADAKEDRRHAEFRARGGREIKRRQEAQRKAEEKE